MTHILAMRLERLEPEHSPSWQSENGNMLRGIKQRAEARAGTLAVQTPATRGERQ